MHYWVRASSSDFAGTLPQPRSGHTAVNIGKSKVIVFGGLVEKRFLNDIVVYDIGTHFLSPSLSLLHPEFLFLIEIVIWVIHYKNINPLCLEFFILLFSSFI